MAFSNRIRADSRPLTRHTLSRIENGLLAAWPPMAALRRQGPLLVLFYRGYWCEHCQAQLLDIVDHAEAFQRRGIDIIAISTDESRQPPIALQHVPISMTILPDTTGQLISQLDLVDHNETRDKPVSLPAVFLLDSAGNVRFHYIGHSPDDRPRTELLLLAAEHLATRK